MSGYTQLTDPPHFYKYFSMSPAICAGMVAGGYLLFAGQSENESWVERRMIRWWTNDWISVSINCRHQPPALEEVRCLKDGFVCFPCRGSMHPCLHAMTAHSKRQLRLREHFLIFCELPSYFHPHNTWLHTHAWPHTPISPDYPSRFVIFCHAKD